MNKIISSLLIISLSGLLFCCTGGSQPPTGSTSPTPHAAAKKKAEVVKPVLVPLEEKKAEYQVIGIRDPFQPFEGINPGGRGPGGTRGPDALQQLSLSQVYLVGVILSKQNRALIQDSSGMGYIITEGTLIGENNGIVTKIAKEGVTIKQHFKDYMGRVTTREVVLSLRKEEGVK
ncbi:MAG TPA: pilus assembly protein PilP [Desulfomonilia bacterium]|nr:pilus assembly protein PilP [Desulfomonilia bacterium]